MQNQDENLKIARFFSFATPIVVEIIRAALQSSGWQVKEEGKGLDLAFYVKVGEKEIKFYLRNLLLEIASIDRDEQPLRFDENMADFDYFLAKTTRLTQSKLKVLFQLLDEEDVDKAIENISKDAKQYERIRIWRIDPKKEN